MSFWQWFWLVVELFFFFAYLIILFQIIGDLFRDKATGGGVKAVWVLLLLFFPLLGAILYLLIRGRGMTERTVESVQEHRAATDDYIRTVAGSSPAQEIAQAQTLLQSGAITPEEFAQLKAHALAAR
jgi:hypothetical protein